MGRTYTRDDVLRLAPDAGSAKSGQDLAQVRKWNNLGGDGTAIWGECQGSGTKPYQVQVELAEPAFKCSCPSRKFPCKHGLGLLLIYATTPDALAAGEPPAWVQEWLASRQARAAKAEEKRSREPQPRDPATQAKRREKRLERNRAGISELSAWMCDIVRGGIGTVPTKGFDFFDGQARRMVDAQAPGAARLVRQLGSLAARGANWQQPFLEELSLLHLLARSVERFDALPDELRADVESALGAVTPAENLNSLPAVSDCWQVIAQEVEVEDRLRAQRTWLYGVRTKRAAMLLQFAHGASAFETGPSVGCQFEGEIVFFPGNGLRAAVRSATSAEPIAVLDGCEGWGAMLDRYSQALAVCPWLERICLPLCRVIPTKIDDRWWAIDADGAAMPVQIRDHAGFVLLAISGGHPVDIAAEYDGRLVQPLSVVSDGCWTSLSQTVAGDA